MDASSDASIPTSKSARWASRAAVLLLIAADTALRFVSLTSKPFWFDECFSAVVARIGWPSFLHLLWWREANMSLYYLLLRVWLHLGQSEFFIRSLSVVISAATIPAVYWLATLLYDRRVALIAAALVTFNAYSVRYAQEARSYALFLLLATLSSALLIAFLKKPEGRTRTWYILVSIFAVYAHLYALLLIAAHWLALRWLRAPSPNTDQSASPAAQMQRTWRVVGLAVLPLLIFVAKTGAGPIRWIHRPGFRDLLQFFENLSGSTSWSLPAIYVLACIAAVAPLGKRLWARNQPWEVWRAQFLLVWLLFPVLLTVALSFVRPVFLARYMIFCLPALLVLTAAGFARLRSAWLLALVLAGTLLFCSQGVLFIYGHDFDDERDASGAATDFILDRAQPGDAILFHIAETRVPYEFFRSARISESRPAPGPEILFPTHSAGLDYRDFTGKPTQELLRSTASHPRLWVMLMYNERDGASDPTTAMINRALPEVFPHVQRWRFARVEVRLYSR
jgi:mannosyltransferase